MIDQKKCYLFGRNPQMCDFCIDHASCSRVHSALVWHKNLNRAFLVDLGSSKLTIFLSLWPLVGCLKIFIFQHTELLLVPCRLKVKNQPNFLLTALSILVPQRGTTSCEKDHKTPQGQSWKSWKRKPRVSTTMGGCSAFQNLRWNWM